MNKPSAADERTIQEITATIVEAVHPEKVILFGSWARGEQNASSDLDLIVIQRTSLPRHRRYAQIRRLFWGLGLPMDILVYTPEEFDRYCSVPGSLTYTVMCEGKVLYERPGS
ncbi:MAG: nucleotidyltransferase domain-containing protein [Anaerolineae bacterium]